MGRRGYVAGLDQVTNQVTMASGHGRPNATAADGRHSAGCPDTVASLICGSQTQCDGVRRNRQALSGEGPDSAVARLRCRENGFGSLACAGSRLTKPGRPMAVKAARGRHPRAVTQPDRPHYRERRPELVSGGNKLEAMSCRLSVAGGIRRTPVGPHNLSRDAAAGPFGYAVTAGLRGVVSRSSFASMSARSVTLETFPTWVRGSASINSRRSGHLYLARPSASR